MGNLTRDPEVRYTPKGTAVATIGLAVNRKWTNEAGEKMDEVLFVDFEAWGNQAETLGQYVSKGDPLFVEGRLKLDQWDDKESGQKRSKLKVVVQSFQFLKGKPDETAQAPVSDRREADQTRHRRPAANHEVAPSEGEDNIPF
jgi:single-strand DNA-binding protein